LVAIPELLWSGLNGHLGDTQSVKSSVMRPIDRVHVSFAAGVECLLTAVKAY
jgi:hypothetical protein